MKRVSLLVWLLIYSALCFAQQRSVTGFVRELSGNPIPYASVVLEQDGKIITGAVSDSEGRFLLKVPEGKYSFSAEFIGYSKLQKTIEISSQGLNLGDVFLEELVQSVKEVVISTEKNAVKASIERTVISTNANISSSKGSVLDILRSLASVSVTSDGLLSVRGKSNVLILMDGVPSTMTDLESIPASNVESVELITNPGAKYDSEGTAGIINILSRKPSRTGLSGLFGASYGFNHFTRANFILANNRPNLSWRVGGNVKYEDDLIQGSLLRDFHSIAKSLEQNIRSKKTSVNSQFSAGVTYRPNKKNTLALDVRLLLPRYNTKQNFFNTYLLEDIPSSENRYSDVTWNRENLEASLSWTRILKPDASKFTLGYNVSKIWGHRPSLYFLEGQQVGVSDSGGSPFITSLQADFEFKYEPGTLEFGAKLTFRRNNQYSRFYTKDEDEWVISSRLSSELLHKELVPALYASFLSKRYGRFSFKAGLRTEFSVTKLHSSQASIDKKKYDFFLAPSFMGKLFINKQQEICLAYGRRIGRPTYPQLNPYMSMIDATTFEQGNPELAPEKSNNIDLSYSLKKRSISLFMDLYLSHTKDYITQISQLDSSDNLLLTYVSCSSDIKSGLDLSLKLSPVKWVNLTLSTNTFYTNCKDESKQQYINNHGWSNNSNLLFNFNLFKNTTLQIQYFVYTPQYYPQFTTSFNHYVNLGLKQRLCDGALSLYVNVTDLLGTDRWKVHSSNIVFNLKNRTMRKSRMVWVGFSYNFKSFKQQNKQTKINMERSRLNLGL
ncbi:MAG: TonB-dependent receptor [Alistipes sp.]|nr:TonB-dependent receptor [Candidatus Alistipes equi]